MHYVGHINSFELWVYQPNIGRVLSSSSAISKGQMPIAKGKTMRATTCQDSDLYHEMVTGCACSGAIQKMNQTPLYCLC
jgi:hypothetical protein